MKRAMRTLYLDQLHDGQLKSLGARLGVTKAALVRAAIARSLQEWCQMHPAEIARQVVLNEMNAKLEGAQLGPQ